MLGFHFLPVRFLENLVNGFSAKEFAQHDSAKTHELAEY
jgi:hypothetical protein